MRIGLLGDLHGNKQWAHYALNKFRRDGIDLIVQLGDFGIWPKGKSFVNGVQRDLEFYEQTMIVVPGNHEDYDQIEKIPVEEDGFQRLRERILLAPRGHRFELGGRSVVALGGAPSVDRTARQRSRSKVWWKQEAITAAEAQRTIDGGEADIMFTHDAPNGVHTIDMNIAHNPHGFLLQDLHYAAEGRALLTGVVEAVRPRLLAHGHYHFPVFEEVFLDGQSCQIVGLNKDATNFSLGALDTDQLAAELWDVFIDFAAWKYDLAFEEGE